MIPLILAVEFSHHIDTTKEGTTQRFRFLFYKFSARNYMTVTCLHYVNKWKHVFNTKSCRMMYVHRKQSTKRIYHHDFQKYVEG